MAGFLTIFFSSATACDAQISFTVVSVDSLGFGRLAAVSGPLRRSARRWTPTGPARRAAAKGWARNGPARAESPKTDRARGVPGR